MKANLSRLVALMVVLVAGSVLAQGPMNVNIGINSEGDSPGISWGLPAMITVSAGSQGLTYSQWYGSGGYNEVGYPLFSSTVDSDATFYKVSSVSGFPVPSTCTCPCPYLEDQISLASSYVAYKTNSAGECVLWISACAMGQCSSPTLGLYKWYWQMRYFSGDSTRNLSSSFQMGDIPVDNDFVLLESFPSGAYSLSGTPCSSGPKITMQPSSQTVSLGGSAAFNVQATGSGTLNYEWYFNGGNLSDNPPDVTGSQTSTLQISEVNSNELGAYYVIVTDSTGNTRSLNANLSLSPPMAVTSITTKYSPTGKEELYFLNGASFKVTFTANIDWGGHPPGSVQFFSSGGQLADVEASGSTAATTIDVGNDLSAGDHLQVQAVSSDGTQSPAATAKFVVMPQITGFEGDFEVKDQGPAFSYSLGDLVDKLIPVFDILPGDLPPPDFAGWGGDKFEAEEECEVKANASFKPLIKGNHADIFKFSIGYGQSVEDEPILKVRSDAELGIGVVAAGFYDFSSEQETWKFGGSLGLQESAGVTYTWPFSIIPPAYVQVGADFTGNATLKFIGLYPPPTTLEGSFGLGAELKATVNVGLGRLLSAGVGIAGKGDLNYAMGTPPVCTYCLSANLFARAQILGQTFNLVEGPAIAQYPPNCTVLANLLPSVNSSNAFDPHPFPRDYLARRTQDGDGAGVFAKGLPSPQGGPLYHGAQLASLAPLEAGAYPFSDPCISAVNTNCYGVWVDDNTNRTINNRTRLLFSKFNGTNWSTATPVADDGTADFHPQLRAFSDGSAVVAWENEGAVLATNATLTNMLSNLQIEAAFYNPVTRQWQAMQQLTSDAWLHASPRIAGPSETNLMLVWVANPGNDIQGGSANPNQLWFTTWNGSQWSTPQMFTTVAYPLLQYDLSYDGTNAHLVMSLDSDNSLTNVTSHALFSVSYQQGSWGSRQQLTTDGLPNDNPRMTIDPSGRNLLIWLDGGTLVSATNLDVADRQMISSNGYSSNLADFKLATGNGRLAVLWAAPSTNSSDFWVEFYDPAYNVWGNAKQLTDDQGTEGEAAAAFYSSNRLVAIYDRLEMDLSGNSPDLITNSDFYSLLYQLTGNLTFATGSLQLSPANPAPGAAATLSALAENLGDYAVSNVPVVFYQGTPSLGGTSLGQTNLASVLAPGASNIVSIPWAVPNTASALPVYAVIDPYHQFTPVNGTNNLVTNLFFLQDLEVQYLGWSQTASNVFLIASTIINQGPISSQPATVSFLLGSATGPNLFTINVPSLAPGQTLAVYYPWNVSNLVGAASIFSVINPGTNTVDFNPQSKSGEITIEPNASHVFAVLGPVQVLSNGVVQAGISGAIGQPYTIEDSSNLANWQVLGSITLTNPSGQFVDFSAANQVSRYYRTVEGLLSSNPPPILTAISNQTVNEEVPLQITANATDPYVTPGSLVFSLDAAPGGMAIDPSTGQINWTPAQNQSPSINQVVVRVSDGNTPPLSAVTAFTVFVNDVNQAPILPDIPEQGADPSVQVTVTNTALEANLYASLNYQLIEAPAGAVIDTNGIITWTPGPLQSPGTNLITTVVTSVDPYDPVNPALSETNSFNIIVVQPNAAPIPPAVSNQAVNELTQFTVAGTFAELNPNAIVSYALFNAPGGMSIDTNGIITWTPSQTQSPNAGVNITVVATSNDPYDPVSPQLSATNGFYVTVREVNVVPILPAIPNQTVNALSQLTVVNTAAEPNIHSSVSYRVAGAPAGVAIDPSLGIITWTPSDAQAGSNYVITTIVTGSDSYDALNPSLQSSNSFGVTVNVATATYTWTNSLGGDWRIPSNWSPNGVPGAGDNVYISDDNDTIHPTVSVYVNTTVGSLTFGSASGEATLAGPAVLTVSGPFNWLGGTIQGAVKFNGGAFSGREFLDGGQVINTGTLDWDDAFVLDGANSLISNAPGASINLLANGALMENIYQGAATFANAGQINVTNSAVISDNFTNSGAVSIASGTFDLQNGAYNSGNIIVAAGATLEYSGSAGVSFTCTPGSMVNDAGNLWLNSGAVNLEGAVTVGGTNIFGSSQATVNVTGDYPITTPMVVASATVNLNGTGAVNPPLLTIGSGGALSNALPVVANQLNWSGGTISGTVQCNGGTVNGEEVTIGGVFIGGGELINTGTLAWNISALVDGLGSVISNAPGAVINMTVNTQYGSSSYLGIGQVLVSGTLYNAGEITVSSGPNAITFYDAFVNTGYVEIDSGTLVVSGGGTNYNAIAVTAPNATLEFSTEGAVNGYTCASGSDISDEGNLWCNSGIINLAGTVNVGGTNTFGSAGAIVNVTGDYPMTSPVVISGATANLNGTGALTPSSLTMSGGTLSNTVPVVAGQLNWTGGWIEGVVQCNGGSLDGEEDVLNGGELINTGVLGWNVSAFLDGNNSIISNAPSATVNMTVNTKYNYSGATLDALGESQSTGLTPALFYNAGLVSVSAGTNLFIIDENFFNTGVLTVNSGRLDLGNGGTNLNLINVASNATLQISIYPNYVDSMDFVLTYPTLAFGNGSQLNSAGNLLIGGPVFPPQFPYPYGGGAYTVNLAGAVNLAGSGTFGLGESYPTTVNLTGYFSTANAITFSGQVTANFDSPALPSPSALSMISGTLSPSWPSGWITEEIPISAAPRIAVIRDNVPGLSTTSSRT